MILQSNWSSKFRTTNNENETNSALLGVRRDAFGVVYGKPLSLRDDPFDCHQAKEQQHDRPVVPQSDFTCFRLLLFLISKHFCDLTDFVGVENTAATDIRDLL